MPQINQNAPGSFSWMELGTSDQAAAKSFYSALFGWQPQDQPMGPGEFYTTFKLEGRDAAAAYTLKPQERDAGVPPHWNLYVNVENADDAVKHATRLGGKICAGPFDVFDAGRLAFISDPTGATFAVWQPKNHPGIGIRDQHGAFCWADLNTPDVNAAVNFYSGLFGWTTSPGKGGYLHIRNGDSYIGGIPPAEQVNPNAPPHWLIYFQVNDCEASTAKAAELGARTLFGPFKMEGVGDLTVLADPQGAFFALFRPRM